MTCFCFAKTSSFIASLQSIPSIPDLLPPVSMDAAAGGGLSVPKLDAADLVGSAGALPNLSAMASLSSALQAALGLSLSAAVQPAAQPVVSAQISSAINSFNASGGALMPQASALQGLTADLSGLARFAGTTLAIKSTLGIDLCAPGAVPALQARLQPDAPDPVSLAAISSLSLMGSQLAPLGLSANAQGAAGASAATPALGIPASFFPGAGGDLSVPPLAASSPGEPGFTASGANVLAGGLPANVLPAAGVGMSPIGAAGAALAAPGFSVPGMPGAAGAGMLADVSVGASPGQPPIAAPLAALGLSPDAQGAASANKLAEGASQLLTGLPPVGHLAVLAPLAALLPMLNVIKLGLGVDLLQPDSCNALSGTLSQLLLTGLAQLNLNSAAGASANVAAGVSLPQPGLNASPGAAFSLMPSAGFAQPDLPGQGAANPLSGIGMAADPLGNLNLDPVASAELPAINQVTMLLNTMAMGGFGLPAGDCAQRCPLALLPTAQPPTLSTDFSTS